MKWSNKKGTPDEQALIVHLLSEDAKNRLIEMIELPRSSEHYTEKVKMCEDKRDHCTTKRCAWKKNPPEYCHDCKNFKGVMDYSIKPIPYAKDVDCLLTQETLDCRHELEVICKKGDRILGYIDLVYVITVTTIYDAEIDENWVWKEFSKEVDRYALVIEGKPEIKAFQDVLRQVKTYRDYIRSGFTTIRYIHEIAVEHNVRYIVATYEKLPEIIINSFENEGILIYQAPKPKGGQERLDMNFPPRD